LGVGLSDLGGAVTWGEGWTLIEHAAADTASELHAELAGWGYAASFVDLLTLAGAVGEKAFRKVAPWVLKRAKPEDAPTADEVATVQAELEESILFG
jgi:hypothetical protein